MKKGQHIAERKGRIVFEKWQDKREVLMLSTHHSGKMVESTRRSRLGNKKKKTGIDRMDQLMSYYIPLRKTLKWYRKVVLQHLDMALVNSYILFKKIGGTKRQVQFRKSVISSLLASDVRTNEDLPETSRPFHHHKISDLSRLSGQHYLALIPATASKKNAARKCVVCNLKGQRKETRYMCETCNSKPALCVVPCFKIFHDEV